MGFSKYANATVASPSINLDAWDEIRHKAASLGPAFETRTAGHVVLQEYKPSDFLLSHCTIIASVDSETPTGVQTGRQMVDGVQIDRRYADYMVTPETSKYINNNNDCWERKLLLASFKTFIGGENYVEHIQIPELSKGKIIDAAARDLGDSVYVDILVATNRKHKPLIAAIEGGELSTLSMGAQVAFTLCTKCGNVAEDELQLCRHIKYQKGNFFIDAMGKRRKIAELCGHVTAEPGSCKFIEGSWVANPAFTGAVLRNILDHRMVSESTELKNRIQVAFNQPARTLDPNALQKAAKIAPVGIGAKAKLWRPPARTRTARRLRFNDKLAYARSQRSLAKVRVKTWRFKILRLRPRMKNQPALSTSRSTTSRTRWSSKSRTRSKTSLRKARSLRSAKC